MDKVDRGRMTLEEWLESEECGTPKANMPRYPIVRMFQVTKLLFTRIKALEAATTGATTPTTSAPKTIKKK